MSMSVKPLAICVENLDPPLPTLRYTQCVALSESEGVGLGLSEEGEVTWQEEAPFMIAVSDDGRAQVQRGPSGPPATDRKSETT